MSSSKSCEKYVGEAAALLESGFKDYAVTQWYELVAPVKSRARKRTEKLE